MYMGTDKGSLIYFPYYYNDVFTVVVRRRKPNDRYSNLYAILLDSCQAPSGRRKYFGD